MIVDELLEVACPQGQEILREQVPHATVVRIQNVADYMYLGTDQEVWAPSDFPQCAPPWPLAWYEWRLPSQTLSNGVLSLSPKITFGLLANSMRLARHWVTVGQVFMRMADHPEVPSFIGTIFRGIRADGGLVVDRAEQLQVITELRETFGDVGLLASLLTLLGEAPPSGPTMMPIILSKRHATLAEKFEPEGEHWAGSSVIAIEKVMWLAVTFAHCKNATIVTEAVDAPLQRKRARLDRIPIRRTSTITIEPMTRILREIRQAHGCGGTKALHLVRGHFKTYTSDAPLLGRSVGTFFWAMHARGAKAAGEVKATYDIMPR